MCMNYYYNYIRWVSGAVWVCLGGWCVCAKLVRMCNNMRAYTRGVREWVSLGLGGRKQHVTENSK